MDLVEELAGVEALTENDAVQGVRPDVRRELPVCAGGAQQFQQATLDACIGPLDHCFLAGGRCTAGGLRADRKVPIASIEPVAAAARTTEWTTDMHRPRQPT